ncbi:hypothetical protein [Macrococcus brunensis]|uniref:hypothetical protein n=1 Tax=Macrococcus brunensis TaxID=198483 RepID=UPI001EF0CAA6|nr:hypothetical protein [Macrococcus brunensis]ULG73017.1 hypothetical protein MGG12_05740 [Macrococcus brunensis]
MKPIKARKKPVIVEAVQVKGDRNMHTVQNFMEDNNNLHDVLGWDNDLAKWYIKTLEGNMYISDGDYIIKGVNGEFYPCKPDIFEATYDILE